MKVEDVDAAIAFVHEYTQLCSKHGFEVSSCGCCGSPWVVSIATEESLEERIEMMKQHLLKELEEFKKKQRATKPI